MDKQQARDGGRGGEGQVRVVRGVFDSDAVATWKAGSNRGASWTGIALGPMDPQHSTRIRRHVADPD